MKRSKKPLTFAAVVATIGALSLAVEGCVYGPPAEPTRETNVYGPPPDAVVMTSSRTDETSKETQDSKHSGNPINETVVYGPPPDMPADGYEIDVYGPPPEDIDE